jgi:prophage regulatory protein
MEWSVGLEFAGDPGEHELDALMEWLDEHGGSVSGGTVGETWAARIATKASSAREAGERAESIVRAAAKRCGIDAEGALVGLEVETLDHLVAVNRGADMNALVGLSDIAKAHGFSRQRAHELSRLPSFPKPAAELTAGRVWRLVDVERFLSIPRRPGRPAGGGTVKVAAKAVGRRHGVRKAAAKRPAAKRATRGLAAKKPRA